MSRFENRGFAPRTYIPVFLFLCLAALAACSGKPPDHILSAGVVDGDVVTVKAAVSGKVELLTFREGDEAAKDGLLATVDSDVIENQLRGLDIQEKDVAVNRKKLDRKIQLLDVNLSYWKDQVERFGRLQKKESVSGDQLEQARLKYEEMEASLFEARQSLRTLAIQAENIQNGRERLGLVLEDHSISSPVAGVVLEKFLSEGEMVFPGTPVADILDRSSMFVETFLEGPELSGLEVGREVGILVDGLEGRLFTGRIIAFGRQAEFSPKYIISEKERSSLLYRVKIRLEHDLEVFKLGMPVTVKIGKT